MSSIIKARPTLYRGIQMRSRLEADFARFLDDHPYVKWEYEAACFAGRNGQYLPDFKIGPDKEGVIHYIEVKPIGILDDEEYDVDAVLSAMSTVWESEPDAKLELWFWAYGGTADTAYVIFHDETRYWYQSDKSGTMFWTGMGQLEKFIEAFVADRRPT